MAKTAAPHPPAKPQRQATRFIVCRTLHGYWIASASGDCVTGVFPVAHEIARVALRCLGQRTP
jgi:hypothetical protein